MVTVRAEPDLPDAVGAMEAMARFGTPDELAELRAFFGDGNPEECPSLTMLDDGSFEMFVILDSELFDDAWELARLTL